jgi:hypothetical protein
MMRLFKAIIPSRETVDAALMVAAICGTAASIIALVDWYVTITGGG